MEKICLLCVKKAFLSGHPIPQLYKENQMFEWYKNISNSLLIHQVNHNRDGVWISDQLISLDFYDIFLVLFRLTRYIKHPRRCLTTNWPRSSYLRLFSRRLKIANGTTIWISHRLFWARSNWWCKNKNFEVFDENQIQQNLISEVLIPWTA